MPAAAHTAGVTYSQVCYVLTLGHTGQGSDPTATPANSVGCLSSEYVAGEAISLSGATPDTGWQITGWTGTTNNSSTAATNSLTMPAAAHAAGVNYSSQMCYTLSKTADPTGGGAINADPAPNCNNGTQYTYGTVVVLTATANADWGFTGWSGACSCAGACSVTMDADKAVTAHFTAVSDSSLVAYWRFDETACTTATDSSGHNNTGAVSGADWTTGKVGGALNFQGGSWGAEDHVVVPDSSSLSLDTNRMTIAMWIYPTDLEHPYNTLIEKSNAPQSPSGLDWIVTPRSADRQDYPTFGVDWNSDNITDGDERVDGNTILTVNSWNFIAVTYDGAAMRFHVDGVEKGTTAKADGTLPNHHSEIWLGASRVWGGEAFYGLIDEVRIYNRALSSAEIQALMIPSPAVSIDTSQVHWPAVPEAEGYQVYESTEPYFEPSGSPPVQTSLSYTLPSDTINRYYIVRAVNGPVQSDNSNRVGRFIFQLVPGQ
jgi:hypothetical protein